MPLLGRKPGRRLNPTPPGALSGEQGWAEDTGQDWGRSRQLGGGFGSGAGRGRGRGLAQILTQDQRMDLDADPNRSRAEPGKRPRPAFLRTCANPICDSGWLHLMRRRSTPVFEEGWSCSPACTRALVETAIRREREGRAAAPPESRSHRIPLGLVMLEQGWISATQLRRAIEAQRAAGGGRLGGWLVRREGVREELVTRALGVQWSCPVLGLDHHDPEGMTGFLPRLFVDAFGALPLRAAAGKLLYLGFEERLDPALALAVERMTGMRVESGLVHGSLFRAAHTRMLAARFPPIELIEAASEPAAAQAIARSVERARPLDARLVRAHECLWLRMWTRTPSGPYPDPPSVRDLICSIGSY